MLKVLHRFCECAGVLALLVAGGAYLDSHLASRQAIARFQAAAGTKSAALTVPAPDQSLWSEHAKRQYADVAGDGPAPVAVLSIERLSIEAPVFEGTDRLTLNRGVGLVEGTARPSETGNTVLSAHRDSFFRPLKDVRTGDVIDLLTLGGQRRFTVAEIFITDPLDVSVLEPTDRPVLTLVTCYPFYYVGFAPNRLIVRAVPLMPPGIRNDRPVGTDIAHVSRPPAAPAPPAGT